MDYEKTRDFREYVGYGKNVGFEHFHKAIEIIYVEKGVLRCTVGHDVYEIKEGELLFVPPLVPHSLDYNNTAVSFINTISSVLSDFFLKILDKHDIVNPIIREKEVVDDIVWHLRKINGDISLLFKNAIYRYCVVEYLDNVEKKEVTSKRNMLVFYNVMNYISEHFDEDLTIEKLAKEFNYSKCYFSELFRKNTKMNFKTYLNTLRIQKSLELLKVNTVAETAFLVGFKSVQVYYSNFYKYMNCTPSEYLLDLNSNVEFFKSDENSEVKNGK